MTQHDPSLMRLDSLLKQLLRILREEGSPDTFHPQQTLERMRRNIALAMTGEATSGELLPVLRELYRQLFPPKAGLSTFYRWHEDVHQRVRLHEEYENICQEIRQLLDE